MQATSERERRLTGLARGMRAAIVVPMLFAPALVIVKEPDMAGFAVFGTFAHLVMVNYCHGRWGEIVGMRRTDPPGCDRGDRWHTRVGISLAGGRRRSHRGSPGGVAGAGQGARRCHPPCPALGVHAGGRNTHTAPYFAAGVVWLAARRHDCAAGLAVAVDSSSVRWFGGEGLLGPERLDVLSVHRKCRLCRSSNGTCRLDRSPSRAASRLLGRSRRSSCPKHAEYPTSLHLLASAGRDLARFPRWRRYGGERWNAPAVVLDCIALCRLCFGVSLERRRLHRWPSGLHRICRGAFLPSCTLAKGGWNCSNRRCCHRWRDQPARGRTPTSWTAWKQHLRMRNESASQNPAPHDP
jgi:hypothetical protein